MNSQAGCSLFDLATGNDVACSGSLRQIMEGSLGNVSTAAYLGMLGVQVRRPVTSPFDPGYDAGTLSHMVSIPCP